MINILTGRIISKSKSLGQTNGVLSRIRYYLPKHLRKTIYFALFHSRFTNAIRIWGQSLNMNSRITKVQKFAVRLKSFSSFRAMPIFKELNIHPTPNIVFNLNIIFAHETINLQSLSAIQETLCLQYIKNPFSIRSACLKLFVRPYVRTKLSDINLYEIKPSFSGTSCKFVTKMLTLLFTVLL